MIEINEKR